MMNLKIFILGFLLALNVSVLAQKVPSESKTVFSSESIEQSLVDLNGDLTNVETVLAKHKGKIILLDLWASWCGDCIKGMPKLKELQANNQEVVFVFFSLDKKEEAWKNSIEKHNIEGEHYWFNTAWKNNFTTYIDLNWIPRYLVLDKKGHIAHYYAIHADDNQLVAVINQLKNN